jgi:hypothetical protein
MSSEEPSKPPSRRWRRVVAAAGVAVILVAALLASALLFREEVAQAVLQDQLDELGLGESRFRVDTFTLDTFAIADFTAGSAVSFDRLTIGFSVEEILRGRIARIELTGLTIDMTQPDSWAGIRRKFERDSDAGGGMPLDLSILPIINIRQARLRIASPAGPMTIMATAQMQPDRDGAIAMQARASTAGPAGEIALGYDGTIRVGADGSTSAEGRLNATSALLRLGGTQIKSLQIDFPLSLTGTAESGAVTGRLSATSSSLTAGDAAVGPAKIELPLSFDLTTKGVTVVTAKDARFDISRLELGSGFRTGPFNGSLEGRLTPTLSSGGWFDAKLDVAVQSHDIHGGELSAKRLSANLAMDVKAVPESIAIDIARRGRIALEDVRTAKNSPATIVSAMVSGKVVLSRPKESSGTGLTVDHELSIVPAPITLPGTPHTGVILGEIETSGTLAVDRAYRGWVTLDASRITRGAQSVAILGMMTRLTTNAELADLTARIQIHDLRDMSAATLAGAPIGGTYEVTATVRHASGNLTYFANFGSRDTRRLASVSGFHNTRTEAGHADVTLRIVKLGSSGLSPESVIPAMNAIRDITGSISGKAKLRWSTRGFNGGATLRLDALGGKTDDVTIEGMSGTLVIDRLVPLSTAPGQRLRIRRIDAGALLADTDIRFALLPSGILRIDRAEATLADGKIIVTAPAIDPAAQNAKATMTFKGVQLEQLLDLVDLGDLEVSGRIYGDIPVLIRDGKIAIEAGALASLGGGTLRFRSERAKQILQSGGEQVALMLRALEDFSYESLGVDIDKSLDGNARVTLRTLGHNPAVLRGRKFQINVNLETNLDKLLEAALEWYRLSGRALRDIVAPRARKGTR